MAAVLPVVPGVNVALGKTVTTTTAVCNGGEAQGNLVDGDVSTKWCSDASPSQATIDLGQIYEIEKIQILHASNELDNTIITVSFNLSVSVDNNDYRTIVMVVGNTSDPTVHNFAATPARWVRIDVIDGCPVPNDYGSLLHSTRIYEMQVWVTATRSFFNFLGRGR